jgi:hypothetical protein
MLLRREFIRGVTAGEVRFPGRTFSVPPRVARPLGSALDQLLPERDVLYVLAAAGPDAEGEAPIEWYVVLRNLVIRIVGSIAAGPSIHGAGMLKLDHEFLPVSRITAMRARLEDPDPGVDGTIPALAVEIVHDEGAWTIDTGRLAAADVARFVALVAGELSR